MKNQNKRLIVRLLTVILSIVLCLSIAVPAFALGAEGEVEGTEQNPATVAITKTFKMPEGTTTPDLTFGFAFIKKALNNNSETSDLSKMPSISDHTILFSDSDNPAAIDGVKSIITEEVIDLTGVDFPYAGAYTYTVTEVQSLVAGSLDTNESLVFSKAAYEITFYVSEGDNGLYVSAIGTYVIKNNEGTDVTKEKVDPTPGTGGGLGAGGLLFTNSYTKNTGGVDPTNPDSQVLSIRNAVAGDFADTSKYFEYAVTVTKPAIAGAATTYKAYILNGDNDVIDPAQNAPGATIKTDDVGKKYIEFPADTLTTIKLKHNETLVFTDVPVGASYVAVNQGAADYTPTATIYVNGVEITPGLSAGVGQSLSTNNRIIGETTPNSAAFINTHKSIPVTGLIINNLPFIIIFAIAVCAFVIFVVVKSRKRRDYSSRY